MRRDQKIPRNIDKYIAGFPKDVQAILQGVRTTIRKAAPGAEEKISYRMPAFAQKGVLVYFAAHQKHIGFYPLMNAERGRCSFRSTGRCCTVS